MIDYIKSWDGRSRSLYLTLDGTSWQLGVHQIHLLVLCLVYQDVSLPLSWHDLGKKGHSSQQERKWLLQQAIKLYPLKGFCLLADREYEGKEWFRFLTENQINFIIRLPKGSYKADIGAGKAYSALLKRALKGRTVRQWFERSAVAVGGLSLPVRGFGPSGWPPECRSVGATGEQSELAQTDHRRALPDSLDDRVFL